MHPSALSVAPLAVAAALIAAPALGADYRLPPPPPLYDGPAGAPGDFNWAGLYGGIHAGYATGNTDVPNYSAAANAATAQQLGVAVPGVVFPGSVSADGPLYGGFVGMNWLWDDAVVGLEMSYTNTNGDFTGTSYSAVSAVGGVSAYGINRFSLQDYGVFGIRGGMPIGRLMPYAGIGLAVGRGSYSTTVVAVDSGTGARASGGYYNRTWLIGAAASVGLDYALLDNLMLRAEYQWVGFSSTGDASGGPSIHTVRAGIGFKY